MSGKHTPGPWSVYDDKGHVHLSIRAIGGSGKSVDVAKCWSKPDGKGWSGALEQERSNAALIAAAPDLLQELEFAQWDAEGGARCARCGGTCLRGHERDCSRAALIAKAKGEQL